MVLFENLVGFNSYLKRDMSLGCSVLTSFPYGEVFEAKKEYKMYSESLNELPCRWRFPLSRVVAENHDKKRKEDVKKSSTERSFEMTSVSGLRFTDQCPEISKIDVQVV